MNTRTRHFFSLFFLLALGAVAESGIAAQVPAGPPPNATEPAGINLGGTSFFDGFSQKPGQWSYLGYFKYTHANKIVDNHGDENPAFQDPSIDVYSYVNQVAYTFEKPVFYGIHPGFTILVPLVGFDSSFGSNSPVKLKDNSFGIGDITFGPYFQFSPVIRGGRPVYSQRFEFDVIAPTGKYDQDKDINPGANFTSLNPYWSATWLPTPKLSISWRLHYLYNFSNDAPAGGEQPLVYDNERVRTTEAGQASWLNFTAAYEVVPDVHVGINGYFFKQFTDDQANGHDIDDSRAQVLGIGPGVFWNHSEANKFFVNFYTETAVRNRVKNPVVLNLHWIHNF